MATKKVQADAATRTWSVPELGQKSDQAGPAAHVANKQQVQLDVQMGVGEIAADVPVQAVARVGRECRQTLIVIHTSRVRILAAPSLDGQPQGFLEPRAVFPTTEEYTDPSDGRRYFQLEAGGWIP